MTAPIRHNPLTSLDEDEDAAPAPPVPKPMLPKEEAQRIAQSFIGGEVRASAPAPAPRKQRRYTTGRNKQVNIKASDATIERLYCQADIRKVSLAELLEIAVDLLEQHPNS